MMDRQSSDHDERDGPISDPDYSALLDEYWEDLQRDLETDSRQWLIDRDLSDEAIVGDLDVLHQLHQLRQSSWISGDGSQDQTVWALETFEQGLESRASNSGERGEPEQARAVEGDLLGGLVSSEREIRSSEERSEEPGSAPGEPGPATGVEPPRRIGTYLVLSCLDTGGQAEVFLVHHPWMCKNFALKLAKRPLEQGVECQSMSPVHDRLVDEARLLCECDHPGLVRVYDLGVHEGRPYMVMLYVPGLNLEQFVGLHRPAPRQAARLVAELAQVVAYLHDRGIVHQDIKPAQRLDGF